MNIAILFMIGTAIGLFCAYKLHTKLAKYEFEHRTSSGLVEFASYGDSVKHEMQKKIARALLVIVGLSICVTVLLFAMNTIR